MSARPELHGVPDTNDPGFLQPGVVLAEPAGSSGDLRRDAVRGGLWSAASQLLPAVGTAVLSVAAGRYLGSGPLGQQSLIAYVNSAVGAVVIISLTTALLQVGGRLQGEGDTRRVNALMRWAIGAHLASGLVVLAVVVASAGIDGKNHHAWFIIGGVSILDALADGLAVRLVLTEGWVPIGRLRLIFQLLGPPLGIIFLFAGYGIAGIFFGDGLAALGLLLAVGARYRRLAARPNDAEKGNAPRWQLGPPTAVARTYVLFAISAIIAQVVTRRVEFVVLAIFSTDVALGTYSVAFMAVNLISMVPMGIAYASMPMVAAAEARGEVGTAIRHLRFALRMGTVISIPLVALLAALGPVAVTFVYGSHYEAAARLVPLASLGLLVAVLSGVSTSFWSGRGRLGVVLGTGAFAGIVDLGVAFAAIPHLAALGAVLSNLAGQVALGASLLIATVRRTGPIGWRLDGLLRMAVASGCGAMAAVVVRIAVDRLVVAGPELRDGIALVLGGLISVVVIFAVALAIRLFDRREAEWLLPLLPGRLSGLIHRLTLPEPMHTA